MKAWKVDNYSVPFVSRRVAEKFCQYWPAFTGNPAPVTVPDDSEPIWRVGYRDWCGQVIVTRGNRTSVAFDWNNI